LKIIEFEFGSLTKYIANPVNGSVHYKYLIGGEAIKSKMGIPETQNH